MQREIGGNIPLTEEILHLSPNTNDIFGCKKFKRNLVTFSARSALNVLLQENYKSAKKALLPAFTCSTCIKPFIDNDFQIEYYSINENLTINENSLLDKLKKNSFEGILYVHSYFGFDTLASSKDLLQKLRENYPITIVDDYTQSWLNNRKEIEADYYLASIRKWFATPDGGVLSSDMHPLQSQKIVHYCKEQTQEYIQASLLKNRFLHGDKSVEKQQFYPLFKHTIEYFDDSVIYALSPISKIIYDTANYETARQKRIDNAKYLSKNIHSSYINKIFKEIPDGVVPFYYPIYVNEGKRAQLQKKLIENDIFCTIHWNPSKYVEGSIDTTKIFPDILSLVCDQRYDIDDMKRMVDIINNFF